MWAAIAKKKPEEKKAGNPQVVKGGAVPKEFYIGQKVEEPVPDPEPKPAPPPPAPAATTSSDEPVRRLVLDTGAIVQGSAGLADRADEFITLQEVVQEVRDKKSRAFMEAFPFELIIRQPTQESIKAVVDVAKKTGDYGTLSAVDLRVLALAHTVASEHNSILELKTTTKDPVISSDMASDARTPLPPGWGSWDEGDDQDEGEGEKTEKDEAGEAGGEAGEVSAEIAADVAEVNEKAEQEGDDQEGWITPANIREHAGAFTRFGDADDSRLVGCMTTDFPMQNVLMHMGILVVNVDGYKIRHLKRWALRCHGCWCVVHDTTKQFCPDCGSGNTLKRVSYTVNEQGEEIIWINPKKKISVKGTIYNLPKPRGGRKGTNRTCVLREDQLMRNGKTDRQDKTGDFIASCLSEDWQFAGSSRMKKDITHVKPTESYYRHHRSNARKRKV